MRIISKSTLLNFWKDFPEAEQPIKSWYDEVSSANWSNPKEMKEKFRNSSIITSKRIVFNIAGNKFRLIVDI